jgi:hypothetical protein
MAVTIDPKKFGGGYDAWNIRMDFREKPVVLHNERTIAVVRSSRGHIAYMDEPLCQAFPTVYVNFAGHERWGRALYENFNGHRSFLLREMKALVEANCSPGSVRAINLAVFVQAYIRSFENMRYLDRYDSKLEGMNAGRFVYFGLIAPGSDRYTLIHHDENGLERYIRTNQAYEASMARMQANQEAEQRLRREGLGAIFKDYCAANPLACAGWAAVILQSGSGGGVPSKSGSNDFMSCMNSCRFRAPSEQAFCQATCYEFIAR